MYLSIINYLNNMDNNSKFLLIIIGIISFLLILIYIINFISSRQIKKYERIKKNNNKRLLKEINKEAKNIKSIPKKEPVISVNNNISIKKEEIEEPEEVLEIDEEVIEILQDDNESDVERILKDIKKASKTETMNLTEFEKEQEETAIISYDELCKRAGVKKKIYKAVTEETMDVSKIVPEVTEKKKFKPTRYVSPIFGAEKEKDEKEDLDKTFLQNLKEFRSTLDL